MKTGGVAWPKLSSRQHTMELSVFTAQLKAGPASTWVKLVLVGASVTCPTSPPPPSSMPQHAMELAVVTAQVCRFPALTLGMLGPVPFPVGNVSMMGLADAAGA